MLSGRVLIRCAGLAGVLVAGGRGVAGQGAAPSQSAPVFRGGVTVVQIDAFVTDAQGRPVAGLTADDFEILEDGQRREVSSFAAVRIPISADLRPISAVEPDIATNTHPEGRRYVIALDEVSPDRVLRARNFARRFVQEHLGPNDIAAIVLTGRGLSTSGQDFTGNRRLLVAAIDKFTGGFEPATANSTEGDMSDAERLLSGGGGTQGPGVDKAFSSDPRQLASSLRKLTEFLAALPGRKTLLYVGEGVGNLDFSALREYHGESLTPAGYDAHAALSAATRGNVTIYPIDPRGLTTDLTPPGTLSSPILENRSDMAMLARITGGFSFTNSNELDTALERIVTENSTYYTLGFATEHPKRDGRFVPVAVRVKRPGLRVRTRDGYLASLGRDTAAERVRGNTRLTTVADALASALPTRGIPMRVVAAPYKATREKATVAIAVEVDASMLASSGAGAASNSELEISYIATDSRGAVKPGRRHTTTVARKPGTGGAGWIRLLSQMELAPGRYQLRVAAGTALQAGSVVYDLEVPDFGKAPIALSGVAVSSSSAGGVPTLRPHDPLAGALAGPLTASREFASGDRLMLFAEVYDNRRPSKETPSPVEVSASLRTERGHVIRLATPEPRTAGSARASAGEPFALSLPLDLEPGDYVVEVEARAGQDMRIGKSIPIRITAGASADRSRLLQ